MKHACWPVAILASTLLFAADESPKYEMANYLMGFLRKGPNHASGDAQENARIQKEHIANLNRMAAAGKLAIAGPFTDNGDVAARCPAARRAAG